jgi:hypothetical protein
MWVLHPLESAALPRRTPDADIAKTALMTQMYGPAVRRKSQSVAALARRAWRPCRYSEARAGVCPVRPDGNRGGVDRLRADAASKAHRGIEPQSQTEHRRSCEFEAFVIAIRAIGDFYFLVPLSCHKSTIPN